jgi:hypothetical protein
MSNYDGCPELHGRPFFYAAGWVRMCRSGSVLLDLWYQEQ